MRKFIFNGMNIGYTAPDRAQDVSYNNTESGLSASTTQTAIDELTTVVNSKANDTTSFTEASTRENIASGESHSTIFGKIKKFFSDLKTVAFSGSYNDLSDKPGVTSKTSAGFCPQLPNETTTTKYLRQDGSWVTPPDNNTTYSAGSGLSLSGTSFSVSNGLLHTDYSSSIPNTTTDSGWSMINSTYNGYLLKSIRFQGSSPGWGVGNYGSGICFGGADTKGIISVGYGSPNIKFAGGNGTKPVWWMGIQGTSGATYNLANFITGINKTMVVNALGYTPPTSDTNNAVTIYHSNSNAIYPMCWEGHNNTTTYTTQIYKCTAVAINPYYAYFYVKHTSDANSYTRIGPREIIFFWGEKSAGGIQRTSEQGMKFEASPESNYWVFLGVTDSTWTLCPDKDNYVKLGSPNHRWNQIYSSSASINTSDRNEKKDIVELGDNAKNLIMGLKPVSYKFINGESGRTHYGMIAQDVEETMDKLGMTALDFAGFCKDQKYERYTEEIEYDGEITNENGEVEITKQKRTEEKERPLEGEFRYGLRYEEFIAPLIKTVQLQQKELEEKDKRINDLEDRLSKLEALIYK